MNPFPTLPLLLLFISHVQIAFALYYRHTVKDMGTVTGYAALTLGLYFPFQLARISRRCRRLTALHECHQSDGCAWDAKRKHCRSKGMTGWLALLRKRQWKCQRYYLGDQLGCMGSRECYWSRWHKQCKVRILHAIRTTQHNFLPPQRLHPFERLKQNASIV